MEILRLRSSELLSPQGCPGAARSESSRAPPAQSPAQPVEPETIRDLEKGGDFESPFDDELDIPTFLRRSAD